MPSRIFLIGSFVSTLLTVSAQAADIPARRAGPVMAPAPVIAVYDWTGFYFGGHLGGGWADNHWFDVSPNNPVRNEGSDTSDGWLGGGQIGYNWQMGGFVLGAELQGSWADISGSRRSAFFRRLTNQTDVNSIVTLAARFGYAYQNWMWYGKVGGAWADTDYDITRSQRASWGGTRDGWMVGLGVEYGWTPNWSAKLEYNFADFGSETTSRISCGAGCRFSEKVDLEVHVVMVGLNYRFLVR